MGAPAPEDLTNVLRGEVFAYLVVLSRAASCVMLLPGFGEEETPVLLRAGLAGALALLLTPVLASALPPVPGTFTALLRIVAGEAACGALLGFLARTATLALAGAGQVVSLMTGLSSVLQPDATLGAQSAVIGRLFNLAAPVLILATGLYALPLAALTRSYALFPAGLPPPAGDAAAAAVHALSSSFALALRLAAPFLIAGTLWQAALGLLGRLVPQLQVYVAALPGQVLGGLLLLAACGAGLLAVWLGALRDAFVALP